jgi:hypothetical protein
MFYYVVLFIFIYLFFVYHFIVQVFPLSNTVETIGTKMIWKI